MFIIPLSFFIILSFLTPKIDTFDNRFHFQTYEVSSVKKKYRRARISRGASKNIFRAYQAVNGSRSCLTGATASILNQLEARVGKVSIVSTCRSGATIAGTRRPSYHRYGMAVDFHTPNKSAAIAFLKTQPVLIMTYSNMGHIHFNTGQKGIVYGANAYGGKRYANRKSNYYTAVKRKYRYRRR